VSLWAVLLIPVALAAVSILLVLTTWLDRRVLSPAPLGETLAGDASPDD
jgi:hypothetical protein